MFQKAMVQTPVWEEREGSRSTFNNTTKVLNRWFSNSEEQPVRLMPQQRQADNSECCDSQPYRSQQGRDGEVVAKQNQGSPSFVKIQFTTL